MPTDTLGRLEWRKTEIGLEPFLVQGEIETPVAWAPQAGSSVAFLECPVFECCYEGTRGPGKSDSLIMSFAQHVGKGWGRDWRGVLFRRTYPELSDIIEKTNRWYPRIFHKASYNRAEHVWSWPTGEQLLLRHFFKPSDYWSYHGHSYPWIGWEEITTWPTPECYLSMFACARSTRVGIPIQIRSTTNPYGIGHNWVKSRFRLSGIPQHVVGPLICDSRTKDGQLEPERVSIHGKLSENKVLLHAQPDYEMKIRTAARNKSELRAWSHGDWDVVAGGMLDDVWDAEVHILPNFPLRLIPRGWKLNRSYDHGQSAPFSVGWWAESNGEPLEWQGLLIGPVRGDTIRIMEWYGWTGEPNEGVPMKATAIAQGIIDREADAGLKRVKPGPADTQIFDDVEPKKSVAGDMAKLGIKWTRADKSSGSRKQGWQQIRKMLEDAKGHPRENPGLFVRESCDQFIRTVPTLPRGDVDLDDVDKSAEDHIGDETRYRLREPDRAVQTGAF